mgnify:CR=1 FL=1
MRVQAPGVSRNILLCVCTVVNLFCQVIYVHTWLNLPECNIVCSVMMMLDCFHLFGLSVCKVFYFTFR